MHFKCEKNNITNENVKAQNFCLPNIVSNTLKT